MSHAIITVSGRRVHVIDSGCDTAPKLNFAWLGQISPDFACIIGGSDDEAHEYMADAIGFKALSHEYVNDLISECLTDCNGDEAKAYELATDGMLALNGGAEWIDADEWGFWTPSKDDMQTFKLAASVLRGMQG